jgi:hypothetical protein
MFPGLLATLLALSVHSVALSFWQIALLPQPMGKIPQPYWNLNSSPVFGEIGEIF